MKKFLIIGISALIFVITGLVLFLTFKNRTQYIAFYNVPLQTQKIIEEKINATVKKPYQIITLDSEQSLSSQKKQIEKASLLFAVNDCSLQEFISTEKKIAALPEDFLNVFPSSIAASVPKTNGTIKYVPLLYDFYEIDINRPVFKETKIPAINTLDDFTLYGNICKTENKPALSFAGGEPADFINITGMFFEALCGSQSYELLLNDLYSACKNNTVEETVSKLASSEGKLWPVIQLFKQYAQQGIISTRFFAMNTDDLLFQIDNDMTINSAYKLSDHRKVEHKRIEQYTTIYCPATEFTTDRKFAAPETIVLCLKNKDVEKDLIKKLSFDWQTEISTESGLAPAAKDAATADLQADDVRYWLAASNGPLMPLSGAFPDSESQRIAADTIKYAISN